MKEETNTIETLKKKEKTLKIMTTMFGTMLILLFLINLFLMTKTGFKATYVFPIAMLPIWILNYTNLKKNQKEIAEKEKQQD